MRGKLTLKGAATVKLRPSLPKDNSDQLPSTVPAPDFLQETGSKGLAPSIPTLGRRSDPAPVNKMRGISCSDNEAYWTEEKTTELGQNLLDWILEKDDKGESIHIWLKDFATEQGMTWDWIARLGKRHEYLGKCIAIAKQEQESILVKLGLDKRNNGTMPMFALKNTSGWSEKSEIKHDGNINTGDGFKSTKEIYTDLEILLAKHKINISDFDLNETPVNRETAAEKKVQEQKESALPESTLKARASIIAELNRREKEEKEKAASAEPPAPEEKDSGKKPQWVSKNRKFGFIR